MTQPPLDTGPLICTCQACGVRHVLGVNATVTVPEEMLGDDVPPDAPDAVVLMMGQGSWPEWQDPPFPSVPVHPAIYKARETRAFRQWKCRTKECNTVQVYPWLLVEKKSKETISLDDDLFTDGPPPPSQVRVFESTLLPEEPASATAEPIRFPCPHCGKTVRVPAKYAGKRGKCPGCGQIVAIPAGNSK